MADHASARDRYALSRRSRPSVKTRAQRCDVFRGRRVVPGRRCHLSATIHARCDVSPRDRLRSPCDFFVLDPNTSPGRTHFTQTAASYFSGWRSTLVGRPFSRLGQYQNVSILDVMWAKDHGGDAGAIRRQSSSQTVTTNKPTPNFLQTSCPSCRPTNSVRALMVVLFSKHSCQPASCLHHLLEAWTGLGLAGIRGFGSTKLGTFSTASPKNKNTEN